MVLRSVWKKRVLCFEGKRVFFEQDYPTEILKKRRAYADIRKMLKENGLHFQTLYPAKLKVLFDTGSVFYNSAVEAIDDLKKRGFTLASSKTEAAVGLLPTTGPRHHLWEKAGARPRSDRIDRQRQIQEKLKTFQLDMNAMELSGGK